MVDITKIQLNPIPLPIVELQSVNATLKGKNNNLRNICRRTTCGIIFWGQIHRLFKRRK
jgi:hypothetical protein